MEITIKYNDAFRAVSRITGISENDLSKRIIVRLEKEGIIGDWTQEVGKSIQEVIEQYEEHSILDVIECVFPLQINSVELPEFLKSIIFWGDSMTNPCDLCGCEMEGEEESQDGHTWTNYKCENPECENEHINEPDWDCLPGGYDYY